MKNITKGIFIGISISILSLISISFINSKSSNSRISSKPPIIPKELLENWEVFPIVKHEENSLAVIPGRKYNTEIYIGIRPKYGNILMATNKGSRYLSEDRGVGKLSFYNGGGSFKNGYCNKNFDAKILLPLKKGEMEISTNHSYKVKKPIVNFDDFTSPILYKHCRNEIKFKSIDLATDFKPDFTIQNILSPNNFEKLKVEKTLDKKGAIFYPNTDSITVIVSCGGHLMTTKHLQVLTPPLPQVNFSIDNFPATDDHKRKGIHIKNLSTAGIHFTPEPSFAKFYPNEVGYKASKWTATLIRNRKLISHTSFTNNDGDFSSLKSKARPNDLLIIEVTKVVRVNSKKEEIKINCSPFIQSFVLY